MSRTLPSPGATAWDFPRSAAGVRHLVAYARRAGLPVQALLVGSALIHRRRSAV